jgi:hypothetical protein
MIRKKASAEADAPLSTAKRTIRFARRAYQSTLWAGRLVPNAVRGEGRRVKLVSSSEPGPYRFFGLRED